GPDANDGQVAARHVRVLQKDLGCLPADAVKGPAQLPGPKTSAGLQLQEVIQRRLEVGRRSGGGGGAPCLRGPAGPGGGRGPRAWVSGGTRVGPGVAGAGGTAATGGAAASRSNCSSEKSSAGGAAASGGGKDGTAPGSISRSPREPRGTPGAGTAGTVGSEA